MVQIYVDALCDLSPRFTDVKTLPYLLSIGDKTFLSSELSPEDIYKLLKDNNYPKTSRPNLGQWMDSIRNDLGSGKDVLYIGSTSKMTGATSSINIIRSLLKGKYENDIYILETPYATGAINLIIDQFNYNCKISNDISMYYILNNTFTLFNNNRLNDNINKVSVITMNDGLAVVDKLFDTYQDAFDYVKQKASVLHSCIDICYSYDMKDSKYLWSLENCCRVRTNKVDSHLVNTCMYTYLGLGTLGVSIRKNEFTIST